MTHWWTSPAVDLEAAIAEFKAALPGWWYSTCECQVSCDASCAPTSESIDVQRAAYDDRFNSGFHADLPQPSTLADALRDVMQQALAAIQGNEQAPNPVKAEAIANATRLSQRMGGRFVPCDAQILAAVAQRLSQPTYVVRNILVMDGFKIETPWVRRQLYRLEKAGKVKRVKCGYAVMLCWTVLP